MGHLPAFQAACWVHPEANAWHLGALDLVAAAQLLEEAVASYPVGQVPAGVLNPLAERRPEEELQAACGHLVGAVQHLVVVI